ncbi:hypothetical protein BPORC_2039 [Bifidobacterium porcinum]|nr:hypothetical protein BPORC_2039 [Bifidobacterium porcinum]
MCWPIRPDTRYTDTRYTGMPTAAGYNRTRRSGGPWKWTRPHIPRVLSCVSTRMAIHLDLTLPPGSSSLPEDMGEQPLTSSAWPCSR